MGATDMPDDAWWTLWELWGGARGDMVELLHDIQPPGLEKALGLVSFGPVGYWPHVLGLWKTSGPAGLTRALAAGGDDMVDEQRFTWGQSKLLRRVAGDLVASRAGYLIEYVRLKRPLDASLANGADLVLSEVFAPHQGVLFWGTDRASALVDRERLGWGIDDPDVIERRAFWATVPPDGATQVRQWQSDPTKAPVSAE